MNNSANPILIERKVRLVAWMLVGLSMGWVALLSSRIPAAAKVGVEGLFALAIHGTLAYFVVRGLVRRLRGRRGRNETLSPWSFVILTNLIWVSLLRLSLTGSVGFAIAVASVLLSTIGILLERQIPVD